MENTNTTTFTLNNDNHDNVPKDAVTVTIHPTVTTIHEFTFKQCTSLKTIDMTDQVTTIGNNAFLNCTSLKTINMPNQVTTIGKGAFSRCTSLKTIKIPDQVTTIRDGTFWECISLITIKIPDQVTTIGNGAFYACTALTSISMIPNQVTTIGMFAFSECTALVSIDMPDQVTTIGNGAFFKCTALKTIKIPDQVSTIGDQAFSGCTALVSISIPNQVTTIGRSAFYECTALTSISIPNQVTTIGNYAFCACTALASIIIPDQVTTIGDGAFAGCTALNQRQTNGNNYNVDIDIWLHQRFNDLPLHQACFNYNTNTHITNKSNLHDLIQQHSVSMLTSTDAMLMTPLHVLCCNPTATLEMIQMLKVAQPDAASRRNVMDKTPLMMLLESKNENYSIFHDERGQLLPLVGLLEQGLDFDALEMIKSASDNDIIPASELQRDDETSGLLPFMYGASLGNCGLDVVYELAMTISPSLLRRTH